MRLSLSEDNTILRSPYLTQMSLNCNILPYGSAVLTRCLPHTIATSFLCVPFVICFFMTEIFITLWLFSYIVFFPCLITDFLFVYTLSFHFFFYVGFPICMPLASVFASQCVKKTAPVFMGSPKTW